MTRFYKVSGAGNDFIAIPESPETVADPLELPPELVRAWCSRGLSLGADGLFLLAPLPGGNSGHAGSAAVRMRYYNADGSAAALCINGTRCAARLAVELGWSRAGRMTVLTGAGAIPARHLGGDEVAVALAPPASVAALRPEVDGTPRTGFLVDAGVPHFVLAWEEMRAGEIEAAPVRSLGPLLRGHPDLGPAGANVDFVRIAGRHRLEIRSFERGVEGETLACGTGVLAAVAAGLHTGDLELPVTALTRGGFELRVEEDVAARRDSAERAEGEAPGAPETRRWSLAGDARLVARGELYPAAGHLPTPPPWR